MKRLLFLGMVFLAAAKSFAAQTNCDFPAVTAQVQGWVDQGYYPGASLLIAKDNRVVYEKCFGNFTPETEVLIASSGKWLATAAIMSLVDDGKLSLGDTAAKWLPEFRNDPKGKATLRQMLSHTSGYLPYQPNDKPRDSYQTLVESVEHVAPLPLAYQPGERFDYGGLAMQVAGRIAEIASGKDWETLFQERIAKPCGMANTHFTPVDQGGGHSPMLGGGARSNLRDYANFLSMIFNDGKFEGRRVLSKKAVREMQADQLRGAFVKLPEFPQRVRDAKHTSIYGLGEWREELDAKGNATLISSPSWAGAYPWIDKTTGVYGVILAHVEGPAPGRDRFSGFYSSPILAQMVREVVKNGTPASGSARSKTESVSRQVGDRRADGTAVWQWSAEVETMNLGNTTNHPRAFLWIPPDCKSVRAVVFGQNNMIEEGILEHREFRKTLASLGIAELYVAPVFDNWQNATNNDAANEKFNALLKKFADESGCDELKSAPIIPIGHSAMASAPWNFAAWNPKRTLAILSVHGDAPQTKLVGNGRPNVDWGARNIDGIPGLMVMGEYEWWEDRLASMFPFREKFPNAPIALLCDAGHGHFDYSDELVRYLALFIRKAAEQRLGNLNPSIPQSLNPPLQPIDPRDGWLMDRWRKNEMPRAKAAKFAKYSGDRRDAFWTFDRETARAAENFNPQFGKAPQLVGFVQEGKVVDQTPNTHEQIRLKVPPVDDSLTFKLTGAFLDVVPAGKNPAQWTSLTNGALLKHSTDGIPVKLSRISGPVVQLAPDTFALRFNRSSVPEDRRSGDIWLLASHPGDANFKSAVQQACLKIPAQLTEGAEQHITFPAINDVKVGTKSIALNATSDAGAKVHYYVREGPAVVVGDTLEFTELPPRAKFPVRVTVVAWQWGRNTEPKLKSAVPVERSFFLTP